jgi:hypothetical protein
VNIHVLSPDRLGTPPLAADQRIADGDPMGVDGLVVVGGAEGVEQLRATPEEPGVHPGNQPGPQTAGSARKACCCWIRDWGPGASSAPPIPLRASAGAPARSERTSGVRAGALGDGQGRRGAGRLRSGVPEPAVAAASRGAAAGTDRRAGRRNRRATGYPVPWDAPRGWEEAPGCTARRPAFPQCCVSRLRAAAACPVGDRHRTRGAGRQRDHRHPMDTLPSIGSGSSWSTRIASASSKVRSRGRAAGGE